MESKGFWSKAKYYVAITAAALGIGTYVGTTYKSEVDDARDKTVEAVGKTFHSANEHKPEALKKLDEKIVDAYNFVTGQENKEVAQKTTDGGEQ